MRMLNPRSATALLQSQGVHAPEIEKIFTGFDVGKPLYEHDFWPDDTLWQLVRMPSASLPSPATGNWFGLVGVTSSGVAINDGLAGRRLVRFRVVAHFKALEGTAKTLPADIGTGIGGLGGATQVYVPRALLGRLVATGGADRS